MPPRIALPAGLHPAPSYRRALEAAGATVVEVQAGTPLGRSAAERPEALLDTVDGLLLPGGADIDPRRYGETTVHPTVQVDPERDELELALARAALAADRPVLGICRGIQVLNVAAGGSLWQDLPSQYRGALVHKEPEATRVRSRLLHGATLDPGSRAATVLGATVLDVNSIHHQAVRDPAPGARAVGRAPDGVIEAIEWPDHRFALGVQWHPEELWEAYPLHLRLFAELVRAAAP